MKNIITAIIFLFLIISFYNCKSKEKIIIGKWSEAFDTIEFKKNNNFLFTTNYIHSDDTKIQTDSFSGTWNYSRKVIYLKFDSVEGKDLFGDCSSIQFSKILWRKALMRNPNCTIKNVYKPLFYSKVEQKNSH